MLAMKDAEQVIGELNSPNIVMGDRGFRLALAPDLDRKKCVFFKN